MTDIHYLAPLVAYRDSALALARALAAGDDSAAWRYKWNHPRFRDLGIDDVRRAELGPADAELVVAREYAFDTWADLAAFVRHVSVDGPVRTFEAAVEAVISGDVAALRALLHDDPALVHARSLRSHRATLLHYVAANGVEGVRQRTPSNAVEVARTLLDAGAEPDALADMYDARCTTMSMLVSSAHPALAGVQVALAELLLDCGAAFDGPGTAWQSAVHTALIFGFRETAEALVRRGAPLTSAATAAGLGRLEETTRLLPAADSDTRQAALSLAASHGHAAVVRLLLDAGADPNRYNPTGYHAHSTPLHQAVWADQPEVVRLLVERGARLDVRDTIYDGTPLDWAVYGGREELAAYLRGRGLQP